MRSISLALSLLVTSGVAGLAVGTLGCSGGGEHDAPTSIDASENGPAIGDIESDNGVNTVVHGHVVTINGNGFGSKDPAAPLKWDTFEQGTGEHAKLSSIQPEWSVYQGGGSSYSNTHAYSGTYAASNKYAWIQGDYHNAFAASFFSFDPTDVVFVSHKSMLTGMQWGVPDGQWKRTRIKDNTAGPSATPYAGYGYFANDGFNSDGPNIHEEWLIGSESEEFLLGWTSYNDDGWTTNNWEFRLGELGGATGAMHIRHLWSGNISEKIFDDVVNRVSQWQFRTVLLGTMMASFTQGGENVEIYIDDVYIDNTWSRVVLGNHPNYSECTNLEMQLPSAWADGSISITINTGVIQAGEAAWLFVIGRQGRVSNGHQVSIAAAG